MTPTTMGSLDRSPLGAHIRSPLGAKNTSVATRLLVFILLKNSTDYSGPASSAVENAKWESDAAFWNARRESLIRDRATYVYVSLFFPSGSPFLVTPPAWPNVAPIDGWFGATNLNDLNLSNIDDFLEIFELLEFDETGRGGRFTPAPAGAGVMGFGGLVGTSSSFSRQDIEPAYSLFLDFLRADERVDAQNVVDQSVVMDSWILRLSDIVTGVLGADI